MNIIVKQMHNVVMIKVENIPEDMKPFYEQYYHICEKNNKIYFLKCCPQYQHEMGENFLNIGEQDSGNYLAHAFNSVDEANTYVSVISGLFKQLRDYMRELERAEASIRKPDFL